MLPLFKKGLILVNMMERKVGDILLNTAIKKIKNVLQSLKKVMNTFPTKETEKFICKQ